MITLFLSSNKYFWMPWTGQRPLRVNCSLSSYAAGTVQLEFRDYCYAINIFHRLIIPANSFTDSLFMPTKMLTNLNRSQSHSWTSCKKKKVRQNQAWHIIQAALLRRQIYGEWCCSTCRYPRSEAAYGIPQACSDLNMSLHRHTSPLCHWVSHHLTHQ